MITSLEEAIYLVVAIIGGSLAAYLLLAIGCTSWAWFKPSRRSSIASFLASLPMCSTAVLLLALGFSLSPNENDRWLFPLCFGGSPVAVVFALAGAYASHRAAARASTTSPVVHPLGWLGFAIALGGALAFVAVSMD